MLVVCFFLTSEYNFCVWGNSRVQENALWQACAFYGNDLLFWLVYRIPAFGHAGGVCRGV